MACLPPPRSIPLLDPVRHGNAPQPGKPCFEVLLDALEATDMSLKHGHIPAWEKTADRNRVRTLAGVQADPVALCKYLPLDGDGDHYTDLVNKYCKAQRVLYSKVSPCGTIHCRAFGFSWTFDDGTVQSGAWTTDWVK
ncbi:hypothetical protein INR49_012484 [Caranx melampygus]|nr:hypothetical protein INR49_012484 [Caranx melampygus]